MSPLDLLLGLDPEFNALMAARDAEKAREAGVARKAPEWMAAEGVKCSRCNGRGVLDCFRHVANGSCFACEGWGVRRGG